MVMNDLKDTVICPNCEKEFGSLCEDLHWSNTNSGVVDCQCGFRFEWFAQIAYFIEEIALNEGK
jgi:transcription elongation factor Elf1